MRGRAGSLATDAAGGTPRPLTELERHIVDNEGSTEEPARPSLPRRHQHQGLVDLARALGRMMST